MINFKKLMNERRKMKVTVKLIKKELQIKKSHKNKTENK